MITSLYNWASEKEKQIYINRTDEVIFYVLRWKVFVFILILVKTKIKTLIRVYRTMWK